MIKSTSLLTVLPLILCMAGCFSLAATTPPSDALPEISLQNLSETIATAKAGDTIIVAPGNFDEVITIAVSGTESAPITIKSAKARKARLRGFVVKGDYITIDGFEITNDAKNATGIDCGQVHMKNARRGARILNNYIHDVQATGINSGTHALVKGNIIRNVGRGMFVNSESLAADNEVDTLVPQIVTRKGKQQFKKSQYAFFAGDNITFRNNYFHGTKEEFLKTSMGSDFFVTWDAWIIGSSHNILIENNRCFNATHASESDSVHHKESSHITYRNNLFANTVYVGILCKGWSNITIENNTFINCGAYPVWFQSKRETEGSVVRNNLIAYWNHDKRKHGGPKSESGIRNNPLDSDPSATVNCDYNMMWGCNNRQYGEHDFIAKPQFIDPANGDFRLKAGSPGIDAGAPVKIKTDHLNKPRLQGKAVDIGAYEFTPNTGQGL